jgi:AcrR family transcriptional regulator
LDAIPAPDALPRPASRRSQAERRSEAERRLLLATVRIVAEQGLERFTLADVGVTAGYSRGLPAHYFQSKEGLIAALANHIVGGFGRALAQVETHAPGLGRLLGTAGFYFDSAQADPLTTRALFVILAEALHSDLLKSKIAALNMRSARPLEQNIRAGIAAGDVRAGVDPKLQAILILSGLRGAVQQWLIDPAAIDLTALRDEFLTNLRRSLAA